MADKNNEDTTINLDALSQGTADEVSEVNDVMGNSDGQTAQPERVTFEQWLEAQTNLTPEQRQALLDQQRRIGSEGNYVVEGRDIGTEVFPNAEVKVFLTASAEERAHRRVRQNADRGIGSIDYQEVLDDIIRRDELDSSRDTAPLRPAEDAVLLDSSSMHVEEVIGSICGLARARMAL